MAVTRIIPIRGSKGRSVIRSLTERTDYVKNPEKTENGALVYAHGCTPQLVAAEFALSKRLYAQRTGRKEPGVIAIYPMVQNRDSCQIRILEIYADGEAYKKHIASEHFQTYKQGTLHMVKSLDLVDMTPMNPDGMKEIFCKMK